MRFVILGLSAALGVGALLTTANAQPATGTITGRVLWSPCIRGIPLPMVPDAQTAPDVQPGPGRPVPVPQPRGLPAGAALVAVQNTSLGTRTDEAGRFSLSGVPVGQYLTVAAGPVADSLGATAQRPNVLLANGGQDVDIGTLMLGGQSMLGCVGFAVGSAEASPTTPGEAPPAP